MRARRKRPNLQPQTQAELTAHNLGALMAREADVAAVSTDSGMRWIADHWTVNDQDAMDAIGPEVFWQWVERGYAGD